MKTAVVFFAILFLVLPALADEPQPQPEGQIEIAMKTIEVGPRRMHHQAVKAAGGAPAETNHVLLETGDALLAEDETVITKD